MKALLHTRRFVLTAILFLLSFSVFAQLSDFTLTVTPTPQTCLGNGALAFAVTGTTPGATISYSVYLASNPGTVVNTTSATTVNSLTAGNYIVIATQSLNGQSNTATVNATIANNVVPLQYAIVPTQVRCTNDGKITVNVTSGVAVGYEIMAGPVTKPLQTSNVFTGLPTGLYQVRVYDNCGEAVVVSQTLIQENTGINIGQVSLLGGELPSCNTIEVSNLFSSPPYNIFYPITLTYTVYPPGGGGTPTVVTQTIASGGDEMQAVETIPFYHNQSYSYNLVITDACGNTFTRNNNVVNDKLRVEVLDEYPTCSDNMFTLIPTNYVGPYTLTFTQSPAGFVPVDYQPTYPNFNSVDVVFGGAGQSVPAGTYSVTIADACGRTGTQTFDINPPDPNPAVVTEAPCGSETGNITITIPNRGVASVTILAAPDAYTDPVPQDLSVLINDFGGFELFNVPLGNYTFYIVDTCGDVYTEPVNLSPDATTPGITVVPRPGCDVGYGSIRVYGQSGVRFEQAVITAAPQAFTEALPHDISQNINPSGTTMGQLYMNGLPEGVYTVDFTDQCGFTQTQQVTVTGYHTMVNDITIIPHCGSFDIDINHESNGSYSQSFWLQKYNATTGGWGHPVTGAAYTDGLPNSVNSVLLTNTMVNYSIQATGQFRIVKNFYVFENGSTSNYRCMDEIYTFTFDGGPQITDAIAFPCGEGLTEVALVVTGVPPFTYAITSKNGDTTFTVDNGSSNLFSGLEPANYNFQVTDDCGNVRNRDFTIVEEPPVTITATGFCEGEVSSLSAPDYTFLNYEWYKQDAPGTILGTSPTLIFPAYNSATQSGTYVLAISTDNPQSCLNQEIVYTISPNAIPNAGTDGSATLCNDGTAINLTAYIGTAFDANGTWTDTDNTGALTGNTFNPAGIAEGTYHFTYTVNGFCSLTDSATVTLVLKNVPGAPVLDAVAGVCEGADVQLGATAVAGATYAWTGPNNFTSAVQNPLLSNVTVAQAGDYYLTVTLNGCTSAAGMVTVAVSTLPNAGPDAAASLCNEGATIDLEAYLGAGHSTGGTWTDDDTSGGLTAEGFDTNNIAAGTYHFTYTVVNFCNVPDSATVTITLNDTPDAPVVAAVPAVCENTDVQLSAAAVTGAVYAWTGPNGFTSSVQNPVITAATTAATGTYSVTVTVNGCTSPATTTPVTVLALPQFVVDGATVLCETQSITLSVAQTNFNAADVTYTWYHDGVLQPDATTGTVEIDQVGVYEVTVDNGTCTTTVQHQVSPNTNAFEVVLDAGCINENYILSIANIDAIEDVASISWTGPDGFNSVAESADITNGAEGVYSVVVTNTNGCSATAEIDITNTHCFIPRGISPGDGQYNDNFDLSNLGVQHLKIFNRYGLQVYEKDNYLNEWYGQSDKGELPSGTYFYVITLSAGKQVTGWVYLQRKA